MAQQLTGSPRLHRIFTTAALCGGPVGVRMRLRKVRDFSNLSSLSRRRHENDIQETGGSAERGGDGGFAGGDGERSVWKSDRGKVASAGVAGGRSCGFVDSGIGCGRSHRGDVAGEVYFRG